MNNQTNLVSEILDILEKERQAMTTGRLEVLSDLTEQKEKIHMLLSQSAPLSHQDIARIKHQAEQNQKLLDAVKQGIKSALNRLSSIKEAQKPLTVYGATGQISNLEKADRKSLERRA